MTHILSLGWLSENGEGNEWWIAIFLPGIRIITRGVVDIIREGQHIEGVGRLSCRPENVRVRPIHSPAQ